MYFLYRKMYLIGFISWILQSLIAEFVNNIFISLACFVIWGFAFYPLYKMHVNRKIKKITAKEFTEEDIKKKGGTSVGAAIILPVVLIVILLASIGIKIMNSVLETADNNDNNTTTNTSKYYSYNGAKIKYGNEWQEEYVSAEDETDKALCEKNGDIIIICLKVSDISDATTDYSLSNDRQELYNAWKNAEEEVYSANGISIIKESNEFKELSNDLYYAYLEIYSNRYIRGYTLLDSKNSTAISVMVLSDTSLTNSEEEKINEMLKTVEF